MYPAQTTRGPTEGNDMRLNDQVCTLSNRNLPKMANKHQYILVKIPMNETSQRCRAGTAVFIETASMWLHNDKPSTKTTRDIMESRVIVEWLTRDIIACGFVKIALSKQGSACIPPGWCWFGWCGLVLVAYLEYVRSCSLIKPPTQNTIPR